MSSGRTGDGAGRTPQQTSSAPPGVQAEPSYLEWARIIDILVPGSVRPSPRQGHQAVIFGGNQMLVFGGETEDTEMSSEIHVFNASTNKWFQPSATGDIPPGLTDFGMALDGDRLLIHGGKLGDRRYSSDLYELTIPTWEWRKLNPTGPEDAEPPCSRMGHSFSIVSDEIYLFGGVTAERLPFWQHSSRLLNDLYVLKIRQNDGNGGWTKPSIVGTPPSPRHHHSATVTYTSTLNGKSHVIIFGGSGKESRLWDLHILSLEKQFWWTPTLAGPPPFPRSFHSATLMGSKMYVFGGFEGLNAMGHEWECSNSVACLSIVDLMWEELDQEIFPDELVTPSPRASHSAVELNNGIVVWSGRDGIKLRLGGPICFPDMWRLEIQRRGAPPRILTVSTDPALQNIVWDHATGATCYDHGLVRGENAPQRVFLQQTPAPFPITSPPFHPPVGSGMPVRMLEPGPSATPSVQLPLPAPSSSTVSGTCSSSQDVREVPANSQMGGAISAAVGDPFLECDEVLDEELEASEEGLPDIGDDDVE